MYNYILNNKQRLNKRMLDICAKLVKEELSKQVDFDVEIEYRTEDDVTYFDCKILNSPFRINHIWYFCINEEDQEFMPEKTYNLDEEFYKDFEEYVKNECINSRYHVSVMEEDTCLILTKYTKCSLNCIHSIFDPFEYDEFIDDEMNDEYDDQDEFLRLCLQKLVYDQE